MANASWCSLIRNGEPQSLNVIVNWPALLKK